MEIERAIEILNPTYREHYDSLEEVNEACRMGMEALKRQKWIPCSERLPEREQRVLFWVGNVYTGYYKYTGEHGTSWFRSGKSNYAVKFWMPMPEAPEEGGNGNAAD